MAKKISIVDVAHALNISKTTVSFVMNGRAEEMRISPTLSDRILQFVSDVGYRANPMAKSLRTGKTNIISLIMDDICNPYFASLAKEIEQRAYEKGFCVIYGTIKSLTDIKNPVTVLQDNFVEACIIAPSKNLKVEVIRKLADNGYPVVLFDHYVNGIDSNYVGIDSLASAYHATKHFIRQGYDHIALVASPFHDSQYHELAGGYHMALKEHNLKPFIKQIITAKHDQQIMKSLADFLESGERPNAILFASGELCKIGLRAINQLGLSIPDDVGIISFDDCDFFELYSPTITAIAQPIEAIVDNIFNLLLAALRDRENIMPQKITLPANLKIRDSAISSLIVK